jgi:hypothetical protein
VEQEDFGRKVGGLGGQEVGGAFVAPRAILASGIVPELIGGGFGEEICFGGKDLSIEEFGFDGVVDTFDIGISPTFDTGRGFR